MKPRIVLFKGVYDTMDLFTDEIEQEMKKLGGECFVFHAATIKEEVKEFLAFALKGVTAVIAFNSLGYNLSIEDDKSLWEHFNIPYVNILMDHPFHYQKSLVHMPKTAKIYVTDENHVKYMNRFYPNLTCGGFLPHAGAECCINRIQQNGCIPIKDRKIEVLYAGGLPLETAARLVPDLSKITEFDAFKMSREVLDMLIETPAITTEDAVETFLEQNQITLEEDKLFSYIEKMRFLDSYATAFFRENAVRVLVESGIPVTVYGSGWDACEWTENKNFIHGGKVLAPEILPLMADSKIVLSTQTWYKAGAHDRIFNGMLSGAGVVTDTSDYLKRNFTSTKELLLFRLERLRELPDEVMKLLDQEDMLQIMADNGRNAAEKEHTFYNRLLKILRELQSDTEK